MECICTLYFYFCLMLPDCLPKEGNITVSLHSTPLGGITGLLHLKYVKYYDFANAQSLFSWLLENMNFF